MTREIQFVLNGQRVRLTDCPINLTLLEYLRRHGLTGAKEGCAEGDCGSCSVIVVERDAQGKPAYRAINSCLLPLCLLAGQEIITVEGVGGARDLHPVQRAMVEHHGSQCGYCTPGFIMSLLEGYCRGNLDQPEALDEQLCGNLCRCTGYRPIRDAARAAFAEGREAVRAGRLTFRADLVKAELGGVQYQCDGETFLRPTSLADLFQLLERRPGARLVAGATELGLELTKRFTKYAALVALEAVPELKEIRRKESAWHIGAAATLTQIEESVATEYPALRDMLRVFGSRQIRNRATMGGNLVTASPIGDSAPVLLALDAQLVLASARRQRSLPIDQFFVSYRRTALQGGEILKTIILPRGGPGTGLERRQAWFKVSRRRDADISTVAACFAVDLDGQNIVRQARLAYGGVAPTPARARKAEAVLLGKPWTAKTVQAVLPVLRAEFEPISDVRGSAEYRQGLITSLLEKFQQSTPANVNDFTPGITGRKPSTPAAGPEPGRSPPYESAYKHVRGEAIYVDDQANGRGCLEVWPVCSPHARARILKRDASAARQMPGVSAVLLAEDIPGRNNIGAVRQDEILLADREVCFHGQIVGLVVGESQAACRAAAKQVVVEYEKLEPTLSLRQAIENGNFHTEPQFIRRGNCQEALQAAPLRLEGEFEIGGQEHFYLETQAAWAEPGEGRTISVVSSTQHPTEVQRVVARLLDLPTNQVVVQCPRMGGGFGGKETQAAGAAALAALAAHCIGKPVRACFNRDLDMIVTGHRHPFLARFEAGFGPDGRLHAARVGLWANGGWALDLSQAIMDRALLHLDNAYYIPAVEFRGQVAWTNLSSNTAMRGFGGPQGMLVIEEILDRVARRLGLPPEVVRERNLYGGKGETNTTPYGQEIEDNRIQAIWHELKTTSELARRRAEIAQWNVAHPHCKRGIAMTPVKFGISFTVSHFNQAGALVLIYQDGTVQVNHSGTEMGQGLHTNIVAVAARELGIRPEQVRVMPTSTDKVPNTSATAASVGTDLNGAAVRNACETLRARLLPVAHKLFTGKVGAEIAQTLIGFRDGAVVPPDAGITFAEVVGRAYREGVSLSALGYYATPGIYWDRAAGRGTPFHYFANGAAVTEVEVDSFTGRHRVRRVDLLQDAGDSINEGVNRGQVEGGFVQGMGWLTTEELIWDCEGRLLTHSPDTYKIPTFGDIPPVFNVTLLKQAAQPNVIYGSKAVGEPPFMLAISVREAIRDAVAAFGPAGGEVPLPSPATAEATFLTLAARRKEESPTP